MIIMNVKFIIIFVLILSAVTSCSRKEDILATVETRENKCDVLANTPKENDNENAIEVNFSTIDYYRRFFRY